MVPIHFLPSLSNARANEYVQHGLCRRMGVLARCLENIFQIFPPERQSILESYELNDIQINLHSFFINVYGLLDNFAWVYLLEHHLEELPAKRINVGLFKNETQKYLPQALKEYLKSEELDFWFKNYATDYRDALAHRIPLYVPPFEIASENSEQYRMLDKQAWEQIMNHNFEQVDELYQARDSLTSVCGVFLHSFSESNGKTIPLHKQLIEDINKILSIEKIYSTSFKSAFN